MQTSKQEVVTNSIKAGLQAFFELAQLKLRRGTHFKKMTRAKQLQVGRALFALRDVAAAPEKYFSRAATEENWRARGAQYAALHGVNPEWAAFYLIPTPADIVRETVEAAFDNDWQMRVKFARFCDQVKDWYYNSTSTDAKLRYLADSEAQQLIEVANAISKQAAIMRDGRIMYYMKNSKMSAVRNVLQNQK